MVSKSSGPLWDESPKKSKYSTYPNGNVSQKRKDYSSDGVGDYDILRMPSFDWQVLGCLTVVAAVVRLFRIYQPSSVVFDEVHFGGFATKYIKGRFFMDVHPPLAKMLIALFGWLAGFKGDFDFKDIGKDYLEPGVPYVSMRLFPALCGVLTIPTIFLTLKGSGCRTTTASFGALLVIFENALVTNNRLILLDSPLITATAFTALAFTCFTNQHEQGPKNAFSPRWWFWLSMTGVFLGATASIKWVGLFTIAWVGSLTLVQLWVLLGDNQHVTPRLWFKHFFARAFCLIVIPATFYMGMFAIHFLCLVNPGEGDGFMSSEFQATLHSKSMQDVPADVAFGSRISLRHHNTQGGYLHSHNHMYPEGSKQQQITLYPHKDENNVWIAENATQPVTADNQTIAGPNAWDQLSPEWIKQGSVIRLYHITTDRRLHSHDQKPPVTEADWQKEVSAYGYKGFEGDANDMFRIEIVKAHSEAGVAQERVRTIQTKFRLVHVMTGCVLFSHKVKLPDWGFEQQEVTCANGGTLPNSLWYIESNTHPQIGADAEKVNYKKPGFLGKFIELNKVMWTTNAGLTDSHSWDSRPPSWPILSRGINFWGKDHRQIYLIGNPVIWFASTAAIALYIAVKGLAALRWQRGYQDYNMISFKRFDYEVGSMVLGWAFHYLPFYLMARQLFLHHYFPALYFAIIVLSQIFEFVSFRIEGFGLYKRPAIGQGIAIAFIAASIFAFSLYAPLAYGNPWTQSECAKLKLFDGWDWDCNHFFGDYEAYGRYTPQVQDAAQTPQAQAKVPFNKAGDQMVSPKQEKVVQQPLVQKPVVEDSQPQVDAEGRPIIGKEEKVEYRDDQGNILDAQAVEELKGQVEFETKYETRTRVIDEKGNVVQDDNESPEGRIPEGIAPPHPDYEGRNPNTAGQEKPNDENANASPPVNDAETDMEKEASLLEEQNKSKGVPKPASERDQATKGSEEL